MSGKFECPLVKHIPFHHSCKNPEVCKKEAELEVISKIERESVCKKCGKKSVQVVSYEKNSMRCLECGHKM